MIIPAAVFLALMLSCMQVALVSSNHQSSISRSYSHHRYLRIYGPSAILSLISISWYHVEHNAKMMQPWIEMANGPASADQSLLLDYINPLEPIHLFTAATHVGSVVVWGQMITASYCAIYWYAAPFRSCPPAARRELASRASSGAMASCQNCQMQSQHLRALRLSPARCTVSHQTVMPKQHSRIVVWSKLFTIPDDVLGIKLGDFIEVKKMDGAQLQSTARKD